MLSVEINAEDAIKKLLEGVIPERSDEMEAYISKYAPYFSLCDDRPGFVVEAGAFGILKFTHRTMLQMWLLGFAAKQAMHSYSFLIAYLLKSNAKFNANLLRNISDQDEVDEKYNKLIKSVYALAEVPDIEQFSWPSGIPHPENGKPTDVEDAAVFDLNCMATAYLFLHEMKHIAFSLDGNCPENPIQEELECDRFARNLMIDNLAKYSEESGYPLDRLKSKRAMSMALGSFFMLIITPKELWGSSQTHPSMAERVNVIVAELHIPDTDKFWIYLASIFLSQLRYIGEMPNEIEFTNLKELCLALIERANNASNKAN